MAAALPPQVASAAPPDLATLERAVISTVAYADVFDYPLRALEVQRYLHGVRATVDATAAALGRCAEPGGALSRRDAFYMLRGRERLVDVRRARAAHAAWLWPAAVRYAHVIAALPFVRMVAVTGSLAWDNVDRNGDIDYLIVTETGHLWTCRWLVALVVRAALLRGVPLCPNYFVSTRALVLPDRNLYAAYEIVRMAPLAGKSMYDRMRLANPWAAGYLPNVMDPPRESEVSPQAGPRNGGRLAARLTRLGERALQSRVGKALEQYEREYRIRKRTRQGLALGEQSYGPDCYKAHTSGHQRRVLAAYAERLQKLEKEGIRGYPP